MSIIPSFQPSLKVLRDVNIFNEELKAIWHQERSLLNDPLAHFKTYTFAGVGLPADITSIQKTLLLETLNIEVSVPDLDLEILANSGGLILPTDRFMSAYDFNADIFSEIEWPAGSGHIFQIRRKEYNPASGRLEMLIRSDNNIKGIGYGRVTAQNFDGPNWNVNEMYEYIVASANRDELTYEDQLIFAGVAAIGDIVFWVLKEQLVLSNGAKFIPGIRDVVVDFDYLGNKEVYRIISTRFNAQEEFYRLLCRSYVETT